MKHLADDTDSKMKSDAIVKIKTSPRILNKYYILTHIIKESEKGNIYQAVSLKNFSFRSCIIKQGKAGALSDQYKRDMKDRLLWQKEVLTSLGNSVKTPSFIDYFEDKDYSYLVLQYIEGTILYSAVKEIYTAFNWQALSATKKIQLLQLYIQVLDIVISIHQKRFIHRDITDSNFILLKDGRLCIIDFELSYSIIPGEPKPPFVLGSYGYMSPEQIKNTRPDFSQDIYSLGALLCYILTKKPPKEYLKPVNQKRNLQLKKLTESLELNTILIDCLSNDSKKRPTINEIKYSVEHYIKQLQSHI